MVKSKDTSKFKTKTIQFYIKNPYHEEIFKKMCKFSKLIYNTTLFNYYAFMTFKNNIYSDLYDKIEDHKLFKKVIVDKKILESKQNSKPKQNIKSSSVKSSKTNKKVIVKSSSLKSSSQVIKGSDEHKKLRQQQKDLCMEKILPIFKKYLKIYSDNYNVLKNNKKYIYNHIIEKLESKHTLVTHDNLDTLIKLYLKKLTKNKNISFTNQNKSYVFTNVVTDILNYFYRKNYFRIQNMVKNHIKIKATMKINDVEYKIDKSFIDHVKASKYLLKVSDRNTKAAIYNIPSIKAIIYKYTSHHLGSNQDKIPPDASDRIITKALTAIKSYYGLINKGIRARLPKFLKKNSLYNLPYAYRSYKLVEKEEKKVTIQTNKLRLNVGKYIGANYDDIVADISGEYVNINDSEHKDKTNDRGTTYIKTDYLVYKDNCKKSKDSKISKDYKTITYTNKNDESTTMYMTKNNKNIFDATYMYIKIPKKLFKYVKKNHLINDNEKIKFNTLEIVPLYNRKFKVCLTYDTNILKYEPSDEYIKDIKKNDSIAIDPGVVNLVTIYNPSGIQKLIKGKSVTSMNNYYNNAISNLQSKHDNFINAEKKNGNNDVPKITYKMTKLWMKRERALNNYFNVTVKKLVSIYNNKKLFILGYNKGWKDKIKENKKMNKATRKTFFYIPYATFYKKLENKLNDKKKILYKIEESYTSQTDALALQTIGKQEDYKERRAVRGLYKSRKGMINADLNGAINIYRKYHDKNGHKVKEITGKKIFEPVQIVIRTHE